MLKETPEKKIAKINRNTFCEVTKYKQCFESIKIYFE